MDRSFVRAVTLRKLGFVACLAIGVGAPWHRAKAQNEVVQLSAALGLTWHDFGNQLGRDQSIGRWGGGGQIGMQLPVSDRSAINLSYSTSFFSGEMPDAIAISLAPPLRRSVDRAASHSSLSGIDASGKVWAADAEYRLYTGPRQSGLYAGIGGGITRINGGGARETGPLASLTMGYAHSVGAGVGTFVEARAEHSWSTDDPRWFVPLVVGLSFAIGGSGP